MCHWNSDTHVTERPVFVGACERSILHVVESGGVALGIGGHGHRLALELVVDEGETTNSPGGLPAGQVGSPRVGPQDLGVVGRIRQLQNVAVFAYC